MNMSETRPRAVESWRFNRRQRKFARKLCYTWHFFFRYQKRDITSSVTWSECFEYFSSFLKYIFCHKSASCCWCFSLQIFTLYYPWVIIIPFSKQKERKLSQKFKSCVNRPILQIKTNEVNEGELSKLRGCIWRPYWLSSFWGESSWGSSSNAKSQMVC